MQNFEFTVIKKQIILRDHLMNNIIKANRNRMTWPSYRMLEKICYIKLKSGQFLEFGKYTQDLCADRASRM